MDVLKLISHDYTIFESSRDSVMVIDASVHATGVSDIMTFVFLNFSFSENFC